LHCHDAARRRDPGFESAAVAIAIGMPVHEIAGLGAIAADKVGNPPIHDRGAVPQRVGRGLLPADLDVFISWSATSFKDTIACEPVFPVNDPENCGICSSLMRSMHRRSVMSPIGDSNRHLRMRVPVVPIIS
jgi:hypothetical protein